MKLILEVASINDHVHELFSGLEYAEVLSKVRNKD